MAETASKTVKQRYQEASYLKVSEAFELMGTGFTELNEDPGCRLSPNGKTIHPAVSS